MMNICKKEMRDKVLKIFTKYIQLNSEGGGGGIYCMVSENTEHRHCLVNLSYSNP